MAAIQSPSRFKIMNRTRDTVVASRAEIACTGDTRRTGLLGREGLAPGEGLWIKPCEAVHTVGMRFAIDLVYLDRKMRVRKVRNSVGPWRVSACIVANSVLELPAGMAEQSLTQKGDIFALSEISEETAQVGDC